MNVTEIIEAMASYTSFKIEQTPKRIQGSDGIRKFELRFTWATNESQCPWDGFETAEECMTNFVNAHKASVAVASKPMTNRQAHERAAGMGLDDAFFRVNGIDPDAPAPSVDEVSAAMISVPVPASPFEAFDDDEEEPKYVPQMTHHGHCFDGTVSR